MKLAERFRMKEAATMTLESRLAAAGRCNDHRLEKTPK
jgi:hypothetical protein